MHEVQYDETKITKNPLHLTTLVRGGTPSILNSKYKFYDHVKNKYMYHTHLHVDMTWFILKSSNFTVSSLALANIQFMSVITEN